MRFEYSEGGSNKFWDIERAGSTLTIKFGKIGANGQMQLKAFGSDAEAIAAHAKLVAEKTKKGYVEAGNGKAASAKPKAKAGKPAASPAPAAKSSSGIKPTSLVIKPLHQASMHRIVVRDRVAVATGTHCFATSNGKKFHRRDSPGTSYGLFEIDGKIYSMGGPFMVTSDHGATWKPIKTAYDDYIFTLLKDSSGRWWLGCNNGVVLTSDRPDKNWKPASFTTAGKVMAILEVDGKLLFVGAGGAGTWDGKSYRAIKGFKKTDIVTRVTEAPSGVLIAIGDGGIAYRSVDRGKTFTAVKSGAKVDLEDCAWVAGALFVVGANGTLLRSLDEGKTFKNVPTKTQKLWAIASWGEGAFLAGDGGVFSLAAPNDTYWKGTQDLFEPPPPEVDKTFEPIKASSGRDGVFKKLHAAAVAQHDKLSASLKRPTDPNPKLARTVDDGTDGADQVYADWLSDQGDPRGELAQVQLRLVKDPKNKENKELKKLEKKLLSTHAGALLGKLAEASSTLELEWHAGFITKARIAKPSDDDNDDGEDGEAKEQPSVEKVLGWLLDSPSARFLRELTVGIVIRDDENSYANVAKRIGSRYLPSLRTLFLGDFTYEDTELNWSHLGNLEPMWPALPNLESLKLRSGSMKLGSIVLPKLRELTVITGGMDARAARAIASAQWPSLEILSLQIGPEPDGGEVKLKDLEPILDGATLPRLTHLGITNFNHTGKLLEPLAHAKILPQLTELDLEMGTLGDEHAARLFALQKAFAHLTKLDVHDNYLTSEGKAVLKQTKLPINFGEQRDDDGPDERYASAYE